MGIKKLPEILAKFNLIDNYENKKYNKYNKKKYTYHIDLFILLFKFIYTSTSWEDFQQRFSNYFNSFSYRNTETLIIYFDYCQNKRKEKLRDIRKKENIKQLNILKEKILLDNNIEDYIYDINYLFEIKKINEKDTFKELILECNPNKFCKKKIMFNINLDESIDYFKEDISKQTEKIIDLSDENTELCSYCFKYAMRKIDLKLLLNLVLVILKKLANECPNLNIIVKKCYNRDAEIDIINNIKNNQYKNNFIISTDNDVKAFALLYLKKNIIISDLSKQITNKCFILKCNKIYSKNIIILIILLHETDYFPGIKRLTFSQPLILKMKNDDILNLNLIKQLKLNELIKYFCDFLERIKKVNVVLLSNERKQQITNYLNDFKLYLSLDKLFYQKEEKKITIIDKDELYSYFKS